MFQIITFKQLGIVAVVLCVLMLSGAVLNIAAPYTSVFASSKISLPIIMYHQISENPNVLGDYAITLSQLEEDFSFLKENGYNPISFNQLRNYVSKGIKLPKKPIVITFDDGERTFITKAVPLLEKYKFPANVNIIGSLTKLYSENGETDDRYAYLNEKDVLELSRNSLVEIGYHTYDLHSLSDRRGMGKLQNEKEVLYEKVINNDIELFNKYFKDITGQSLFIMAYPYGIKNNTLEEIIENSNFTVSLSCREALNEIYEGCSLYNLARFNRPHEESTENFFGRILEIQKNNTVAIW